MFDTDLTNPSYSYASQPNVAKCVSDYELCVFADGVWTAVGAGRDNYMRRALHRFAPVRAEKLRVTVTKTCGDASARILELRAYAD